MFTWLFGVMRILYWVEVVVAVRVVVESVMDGVSLAGFAVEP